MYKKLNFYAIAELLVRGKKLTFKLIDIIALYIEINEQTLYPCALKNNGQSCQVLAKLTRILFSLNSNNKLKEQNRYSF